MLAAGMTLGPYRILAPLGAGGMGEVYRAHDPRLGRDVAIKVLPPHLAATPEVRARFEREARAVSHLNHPNIGALYDIGEEGGLHYLVMELLEGETLAQRLARGPLPVPELLRAAMQIADALDAAHCSGIVHRDLKPPNVMLTRTGARLLDFGLARPIGLKPWTGDMSASPTVSEPLTAEGTLVGTLQYMAPEQVEGREADARTDVFAFGAMLHEMASGRKAFAARSQAGLIAAILEHDPAPLSSLVPNLPPALDHVVSRCLAKDPDQRWQTMRDVLHELEWIRDESSSLRSRRGVPLPDSGRAGPERPRSGRRAWLAGAAALAVVAAIAAVLIARAPLMHLIRDDHGRSQKRQWTLVAEFEGPVDDPGLASAAREMVISVLDQSAILSTVPRDQVREALRLAGKPDSTRVGAELARELAYRSAIRTLVSGNIDRLGTGYPITLRVHDVERDSLLVTVSGVAGSEKELIPTLDRLARRLREQLGEHPEAIAATRTALSAQAATPSFTAYRKFVRAMEMNRSGDPAGSIAFCREALAIDPGFARARLTLGINFANLGQYDSAAVAYRLALSAPERLTEYHRILTEALLATNEGDLVGANAAYDRLIVEDSSRAAPWTNRALNMLRLGRFDEYLEGMRQAVWRSPVAPSQAQLGNLATACLILGRLGEADSITSRLTGANAQAFRLEMAQARADWRTGDSLARVLARNAAVRADVRAAALDVTTFEAIARGELADVARQQREAHEAWRQLDPLALDLRAGRSAMLAWTMALELPEVAQAMPEHAPTAVLLTHATVAAVRGDTLRARRLLGRGLVRPPADLRRQGATPALVQALIAARGGRWNEVVERLDPIARREIEIGFVPYGVGQAWPRVLMGEAYEHLGRRDSAAFYFELLLPSRTPPLNLDVGYRRALSSYAHYHLVLLYAGMGRREEAERHWKGLSETLTHPDPGLRHWLDEARAAVMAVRAIHKATRA